MRLGTFAQFALLAAAMTLASCENKKADSPAVETSTHSETSTTQTAPATESESAAVNNSAYKRYAIDHAHIHYEVSGYRRGVEDLYFGNWGRKEARYINVENLTDQGVRPDRTVIITHGAQMKVANLVAGEGMMMNEPSVDSLMRASTVESPEAISDSILSRMRYVRQGEESVLGKTTNVWFEQSSGTKLYTWKGIVLKQEVNNPQQKHTVVATSIDISTPIPDSIFVAPKSITYSTMPARPGGRR